MRKATEAASRRWIRSESFVDKITTVALLDLMETLEDEIVAVQLTNARQRNLLTEEEVPLFFQQLSLVRDPARRVRRQDTRTDEASEWVVHDME